MGLRQFVILVNEDMSTAASISSAAPLMWSQKSEREKPQCGRTSQVDVVIVAAAVHDPSFALGEHLTRGKNCKSCVQLNCVNTHAHGSLKRTEEIPLIWTGRPNIYK